MPDLRPILPLLGFLALMLGACDTAVSPLRDDPDAFFALHGYLDTGADTQYVRVEALRSTVAPETTAFLDATVHSLDEATGATRAWHDSLVTLEDGRPGHLFFAPFRPEPGRTYRLVVTRSDGARTEARITTPAPPRARPALPVEDGFTITQPVTLEGLTRPPRDLRLVYRIASTRNPVVQTHAIGYGEAGTPVPGGWRVTVQLKRDADLLHRRYVPLDDADTTLTFHGVAMAFTVTGPEWDTGSTDANISGGHGFFGAVGRFTVAWHLDPVTVGTLGFLDRQETP